MNSDSTSLDHRLLDLLHAVRDTHDDSARASLNELLRDDPAARAAIARLMVDEQALITRLRDDSIVSLLDPASSGALVKVVRFPRWFSWRPLTAAAAGIVFGMFCTSMVFGYVAHRAAAAKLVPLAIFDPGLENAEAGLDDGLPRHPGQWGVDSAALVSAENGVKPLQGGHMLRLEPILREKKVKNHASRVYQVLDLRTLRAQGMTADAEVRITASFSAVKSEAGSRYVIRAIALDEPPETATKDFWSKTERDDAVSVSRRFDAAPGALAWHTFSMEMPLPSGAKTLVFILGAIPPEDSSAPPSTHYLDDVKVAVITPQPALP
jgi:hypothetical protein